jgi:hypothetical protein
MPQHAINDPATGKRANGGSFPAIVDTLADAKGSESTIYAIGYTTMHRAVCKILQLNIAKASFLGQIIVVVVPVPSLLNSLYEVLVWEVAGRLGDVWKMLELPMRCRRKKKMEI